MTHQPGAYPPAQPRTQQSPYALSRRTISLLVVVILGLLVFSAGQLVRMPYVIFKPGQAQDTLGRLDGQDIVSVSGTKTYPTTGSLDFTTVAVYGGPDHPVSLWTYLQAKVDKNSVIRPEKEVFGDKSGQQIEQESAAEMTGSQQSAEVVAVRATGSKVGERVYVGSVASDGPANGKLKVQDLITSINGKPTTTVSQLHGVMDTVKAGETVTVVVERDGKPVTTSIATKRREDGRAIIGVILAPRYTFPYTVRVNAGDVGGPSAGLMFSLAIYDKLTPGALTNGKDFAGTGTIDADGVVGPIGGIRQKMVGARESGAEYFLAPNDNCNEVKGHVPDGLAVYKVGTFNDARGIIQKVASGTTTGLPTC